MELVTTGTRRFCLHGIDETGETPYLTGDVSWLDDGPVSRTDSELAATLVSEVTAYRVLLGAAPLTDADLPALHREALEALALADRQRVLDAPDVTNRLRVACELVRRERALVERLGSVPQLPDGWSPAWWN